MGELRNKCPWDKKQTLDSLRYLTIEETYELADAILDNDLKEIKKRAWRHPNAYCVLRKIESEKKVFDIADVAEGIYERRLDRMVPRKLPEEWRVKKES